MSTFEPPNKFWNQCTCSTTFKHDMSKLHTYHEVIDQGRELRWNLLGIIHAIRHETSGRPKGTDVLNECLNHLLEESPIIS